MNQELRKTKANYNSCFKIRNSSNSFGFTLIELLIVIAVIGAMASIFVITFPAAQKRARDAQRKSDIKQYQTSLESYANKNAGGLYPGDDGNLKDSCADLGLVGAACVDDPKATNPYQIQSSDTDYVIWARLEMPNTSSQTVYFVSCSTGVSGEDISVPVDENCPL